MEGGLIGAAAALEFVTVAAVEVPALLLPYEATVVVEPTVPKGRAEGKLIVPVVPAMFSDCAADDVCCAA